MNVALVLRFIEVQALLLTPIAPHVAEYLWSTILEHHSSVQLAQFPKIDAPVDHAVLDSAVYTRSTIKEIRDGELAFAKKKGKGKTVSFDPTKPKGVKIYVASGFPEWQEAAVAIVRRAFDEETKKVDDAKIREELAAKGLSKDKKYMPFIASFKVRPSPFFPPPFPFPFPPLTSPPSRGRAEEARPVRPRHRLQPHGPL